MAVAQRPFAPRERSAGRVFLACVLSLHRSPPLVKETLLNPLRREHKSPEQTGVVSTYAQFFNSAHDHERRIERTAVSEFA